MASPTDPEPFPPAVLALASGEVFTGKSFGHPGPAAGEVVFNTSLTGYQEITSDPSYRGQLVCMTAPHIGIVGVNQRDIEADKAQISALIIRSLARSVSNWRADKNLAAYLRAGAVAGITEIDTRRLTCVLRGGGAVNGCVLAGEDAERAVSLARDCPAMSGNPLGKTAGHDARFFWSESRWLPQADAYESNKAQEPAVAVLDCGAKRAILRELASRQCQVEVIPYLTDAAQIAGKFAGVVISNGPGDPEPLAEGIALARAILERGVPLLGICLGHQVLGLACGAQSVKMKFGHHGSNHPVLDRQSGKVFITAQNHGFALAEQSIPADLEITHVSLFDGSVQGLRHKTKPMLSFQGHPEASPGPREMSELFDRFADLLRNYAAAH